MAKKASHHSEVNHFTDIPNIGKAMAEDLRVLGFKSPTELRDQDGFELHARLCRLTGVQHDPCVIDTFLAAIDFMNGGVAKPWWAFTPLRKAAIAVRQK